MGQLDEIEAEAWRAGYSAAVEQVRVAGAVVSGSRGTILRRMARTLEATRDEVQERATKYAEIMTRSTGQEQPHGS